MEKTYIKCGIKERDLLTKIIPKLCKNKSYDYETSPTDSLEVWDCKLYVDNKKILIEVKIRDKHFNSLFLELKKYRALMKMKLNENFDYIYYINETPSGYYIARIDNIKDLYISYIMAPVSSVDKSKGMVEKAMIELSVENDFKKIII